MARSLEIKDGRILVKNAAGDDVFNTDDRMMYFIAEKTGTLTLPFRQNINNVPDTIPDTSFVIANDLPVAVTWCQGMVRNRSNNRWSTDWLCIGGCVMFEWAVSSGNTPLRHALATLRLEPPYCYLDTRYFLTQGESTPASDLDYYLVFGGFN